MWKKRTKHVEIKNNVQRQNICQNLDMLNVSIIVYSKYERTVAT